MRCSAHVIPTNLHVWIVVSSLTLSLASACASHEDIPDPGPPVLEPALMQEAEPAPVLPAVVAPPLPELVPTRPLENLRPLWHSIPGLDQPASTLLGVGQTGVQISSADATGLGLIGSGVELSALPITQWRSVRVAGPLVLLDTTDTYTAFDIDTNQVRWTGQLPDARSYMSIVSPRVLVAYYYETAADSLLGWSLHDGGQIWQREGQSDVDFDRIKWLETDGVRGYFTSALGLVAFDLHTGATLWSATISSEDCGVAVGEGVVVIEDPAGHRMLEAELGREIARFDGRGTASCTWALYADAGVAPAVIDGERLYAFDSQVPAQGLAPLRAFALDTRRELWTASGFDDDLLVVDHDAVFVSRDERALLGLDADTGQPRMELSIGAGFNVYVEPVGGAAGPYVVVSDDEFGEWVLGRADTPTTPEAYELRGQLIAEPGLQKRRLAGVRVRVGEQIVKTDKRGRFIAKGSASGAVRIEQAAEFGEYDPGTWTQVAIDPQRIMLDGSGRYVLDSILAYEVSME
jgi:outer membrane protein assembly factor BamB